MTLTPVVKRTLILLVASTLLVLGAVGTGLTDLGALEAPGSATDLQHDPRDHGGP